MEWFLIKQNEHLGPFTKDTLKNMLSSGEVNSKSQFWREGLIESVSYEEVFAQKISNIEETDFPPDLPPLPPDAIRSAHKNLINSKKVITTQKVIKKASTASPKPVTKPVVKKVKIPKPIVETVIEELVEFSESEATVPIKNRYFRPLVYLCLLIVISGSGLGSWIYYQKKANIFSRPKLMGLRDFKRLKSTSLKSEQGLKFSIALAKDKKSLWIASNNPYQGEVFIQLKSIKGKSLGEPVEVKASGYLKQKLISLSKFQFVTGSRFVDGIYNVEIFTVDDLTIPFVEGFFEKREVQLKFIDQFLITSMSGKEFKKQLIKMIKAKKSNSKLFWEELVQKYQTVKMITGQIRDGFSNIFEENELNWKRKVEVFETEYKSKYGIFFTEFVKTNEASYAKLSTKKFDNSQEVLANYNHLSTLATDIGAESMQVLGHLQQLDGKALTPETAVDLKKKSLIKLNEIIIECEKKIQSLSSNK